MEFNLEAAEIKVFEVKAKIYDEENDKVSTRLLGYTKTEEEVEIISKNISHEIISKEVDALIIKKKSDEISKAISIIPGREFQFIYYIKDPNKINMEQLRTLSKDEKKFIDFVTKQQE